MKDWSHTFDCGCKVTFFAESSFLNDRLLPGENCAEHVRREQYQARSSLIDVARKLMVHSFAQDSDRLRTALKTCRRRCRLEKRIGTRAFAELCGVSPTMICELTDDALPDSPPDFVERAPNG